MTPPDFHYSFRYSIYIGLFTIDKMFPYIGVGSQIVTDEKLHFINSESIFPPDAKRRLVILGDSRILSGFIPALFDELSSGTIYALEDRTQRVYPWMNERQGRTMGRWKLPKQLIALTV